MNAINNIVKAIKGKTVCRYKGHELNLVKTVFSIPSIEVHECTRCGLVVLKEVEL